MLRNPELGGRGQGSTRQQLGIKKVLPPASCVFQTCLPGVTAPMVLRSSCPAGCDPAQVPLLIKAAININQFVQQLNNVERCPLGKLTGSRSVFEPAILEKVAFPAPSYPAFSPNSIRCSLISIKV